MCLNIVKEISNVDIMLGEENVYRFKKIYLPVLSHIWTTPCQLLQRQVTGLSLLKSLLASSGLSLSSSRWEQWFSRIQSSSTPSYSRLVRVIPPFSSSSPNTRRNSWGCLMSLLLGAVVAQRPQHTLLRSQLHRRTRRLLKGWVFLPSATANSFITLSMSMVKSTIIVRTEIVPLMNSNINPRINCVCTVIQLIQAHKMSVRKWRYFVEYWYTIFVSKDTQFLAGEKC